VNRIFLVRHGGSTANRNPIFYNYSDSAVCLTTQGVRQALNTGGVLKQIDPRWEKPGNFALEVYRSEYFRTYQTSRIALDQMGLLSVQPAVSPLLNERDYGTAYEPAMDTDPNCDLNGSESSVKARLRLREFLEQVTPILPRADVMAFSHMGAMRALIAEILGLSDDAMMKLDIPNGRAFQFNGTPDAAGHWHFAEQPISEHLLTVDKETVSEPPKAPAASEPRAALTRGGPSMRT
jgi:broad specificity phosphatase PhoE